MIRFRCTVGDHPEPLWGWYPKKDKERPHLLYLAYKKFGSFPLSTVEKEPSPGAEFAGVLITHFPGFRNECCLSHAVSDTLFKQPELPMTLL